MRWRGTWPAPGGGDGAGRASAGTAFTGGQRKGSRSAGSSGATGLGESTAPRVACGQSDGPPGSVWQAHEQAGAAGASWPTCACHATSDRPV